MANSTVPAGRAPAADKYARQRVRGIFILVFGLALSVLGLFLAPWGLIGLSAVNGIDVSQAISSNDSQLSVLTSLYLGTLMIYLPFFLAAGAVLLAVLHGRLIALRVALAAVCVGSALMHALTVRDAFGGTAGYGSWMVGGGYLVIGYGCVVVMRASLGASPSM